MLAIYIGTILFIYIYSVVVWAFPPCVGPCAVLYPLLCFGDAAAPLPTGRQALCGVASILTFRYFAVMGKSIKLISLFRGNFRAQDAC